MFYVLVAIVAFFAGAFYYRNNAKKAEEKIQQLKPLYEESLEKIKVLEEKLKNK